MDLIIPGGNVTTAGTQTLTNKTATSLVLTAGTTAVAPLTVGSGTNLTSPAVGAVEFDGAGFYMTDNTTSGRMQVVSESHYLMTGDGSASGVATITDFFPATSSFSTVANGIYIIEYTAFFLKSTAGTMIWTVTNSGTYTNSVGLLLHTANTGVATDSTAGADGVVTNTTAAMAFPATVSLSTVVNHCHRIWVMAECGTAGNIRLRGTPSAGTFTPLRGSHYKVRRLGAATVGTFVA